MHDLVSYNACSHVDSKSSLRASSIAAGLHIFSNLLAACHSLLLFLGYQEISMPYEWHPVSPREPRTRELVCRLQQERREEIFACCVLSNYMYTHVTECTHMSLLDHIVPVTQLIVYTCKGQVIQATFLFNLCRNIVVLQVEGVVAHTTNAFSTCHATNFSVASCDNMLCKVDPGSTFCNKFFQLATLKFVVES